MGATRLLYLVFQYPPRGCGVASFRNSPRLCHINTDHYPLRLRATTMSDTNHASNETIPLLRVMGESSTATRTSELSLDECLPENETPAECLARLTRIVAKQRECWGTCLCYKFRTKLIRNQVWESRSFCSGVA
jgi:hypothetical protein